MDLQSLIDFMSPSSAKAENTVSVEPVKLNKKIIIPVKKEPTFSDPMAMAPEVAPQPAPALSPLQRGAVAAGDALNTLKQSGVGAIGDKASVTGKYTDDTTDTRNYALDEEYLNKVGGAIRNTPEWKKQAEGLNDLEQLIALDAERNAGKSNIDLSALGAYQDMQNKMVGINSNLGTALKGTPIEDTSIKDMAEVQRRRSDMAKELINTIKASKIGQVVTKDGQVIGVTSGFEAPKPINPTGANNLHFKELSALRKYTDASFKEPAHQLETINNMISRVMSENPSYIGALPAKLEQMDTGQQRVLLGLIGMETYDNSAPAKLAQYLKTLTGGTLTEHTKALLIDRLNRSADDAKLKMKAVQDDVNDFASSMSTLGPEHVDKIVGSKVRATEKANPRAMKAGGAPEKFTEKGQAAGKALTVDDLWERRAKK